MSDRGLSLADLDGTVHTIAALWEGMPFAEKRSLSRDFTDALDVLIEHINAPVTEDLGPVEPPAYPAERRVADLERFLDAQRRRAEALHHARKSWVAACDVGQNVADHARSVLRVAEAYERYLTDGTVPPAPAGREPFEAPPTPVAGRKDGPQSQDDVKLGTIASVVDAALAWVDRSHTHNLGGPENWRNWADEQDVALINAVLAYRGLPPLERKSM
jgi:hypothetical protein